ncbi:universal stress protein [Haloarcula sp. JP-L23]|uniref:universal stress protein n=1 Tax=Haloarcula sp. JP-L23 TaxID=2716717 RepID=UPI00140F2EE8|nr:universal stress protein [Haloarcula sp. JP-L23]
MYDRILVPTDGSEGMSRVVDHAVELARFHDAEVHGLYVIDTGSYATLPVETTWDGVTEMLREEGELALESLETMTGDLEVVTAIEKGAPSKQIVEYARENGCDTIVMGTHGRGGLDRILLGSVAERVVRSSPVPVVTVPVGDTDVDPGDDEPEASVTQ